MTPDQVDSIAFMRTELAKEMSRLDRSMAPTAGELQEIRETLYHTSMGLYNLIPIVNDLPKTTWADANTGITIAQEQEQTHLENVAKLIGTYYNTLVEEGLPDGLIFNLISDYQHFTFSRWMDEQEG